MALRLTRLMEAASVKEAIRATPRNAKTPAACILVPPEGWWPTARTTVQQFIPATNGEKNARPSLPSFLPSFLSLSTHWLVHAAESLDDQPTD